MVAFEDDKANKTGSTVCEHARTVFVNDRLRKEIASYLKAPAPQAMLQRPRRLMPGTVPLLGRAAAI
jgi:hypothetical protein